MDGMTVLHVGLEEISNRLHCSGKRNFKGIIIVVLRLALIPFTATLFLWETDPGRLSMIGLLCVLFELFLRKLGNFYLAPEDEEKSPAGDEQSAPEASPRNLRQSVLMASAFVNMSASQLAALEALDEESEDLE